MVETLIDAIAERGHGVLCAGRGWMIVCGTYSKAIDRHGIVFIESKPKGQPRMSFDELRAHLHEAIRVVQEQTTKTLRV